MGKTSLGRGAEVICHEVADPVEEAGYWDGDAGNRTAMRTKDSRRWPRVTSEGMEGHKLAWISLLGLPAKDPCISPMAASRR